MVNYQKYLDLEIFEGDISFHEYPWHFHDCFTLIVVEKGLIKYEFHEKQIQVDHKIPAGALNCGADLEGFVERLFCESKDLQVLCTECHNVKTQFERASNKKKKEDEKNNKKTL